MEGWQNREMDSGPGYIILFAAASAFVVMVFIIALMCV